MTGCISSSTTLLGLVTLITIHKARNGPIVIIQNLIPSIPLQLFYLLLTAALISACTSAIIALYVSKFFAKIISKLNYKVLCEAVLAFLILIVLVLSGLSGLLLLLTAGAIGMIPNYAGCSRSSVMGALLLPVILYYLL